MKGNKESNWIVCVVLKYSTIFDMFMEMKKYNILESICYNNKAH